ncbi:AraC family transcriptional regulator [Pedobacter sp. Du54]|uniref:helix-turn-helix domain-containing protein n=1 Tax=Pedobacter anseongensis TaxID=3133439 RepID=UPI0030AA6C98
MPSLSEKPKISHSCYYEKSREGEQFVSDHVFSYQVSGSLTLIDGAGKQVFTPGDFRLIRRNQLVKFLKEPPAGGAFRSFSVYLDQQTLRTLSIEHTLSAALPSALGNLIKLAPKPLLKSYIDSLAPYSQQGIEIDPKLIEVKLREGILILLQSDPRLKDILFDFSDPVKTDLQGFMEKNFHFNVPMERFAYLTGRSLATFKRDFDKFFQSSPGRWLQQRRLQEAHYQISEKGRSASEVYLEVGFEDLSHFSFAFKKRYGVSPSRV